MILHFMKAEIKKEIIVFVNNNSGKLHIGVQDSIITSVKNADKAAL